MLHFRKLRVLVLTHPDLVPPKSVDRSSLDSAEWKAEYDVVKTLNELGHETHIQGVYDDPAIIRQMAEQWKPHVTFNLLEEFAGERLFDQNVVSYLEMLGIPYTGCNPRGLMLARDKGLAKMILAYHCISTPKFAVFPRGYPLKRLEDLKFPLFVKSVIEEASHGISQGSIVHSPENLMERIGFIHENIGTDAIVESYIKGREFYVGVMGNIRTETFPIWELRFGKTPEQVPRIATKRVKFNTNYRKKYGINTGAVSDLAESDILRIQNLCKRAFRILGLNGYARMDLRLCDETQKLYLLEANPNPHIGMDEDFAQSAKKQGLDYSSLISRIVHLGLKWQPPNLTQA